MIIKAFIATLSFCTLLAGNSEKKYKTMSSSLINVNSGEKTDTATFATGCFWCTEAIFQELNGVLKVTSGYSGGKVNNPTYKQICTGETGHAECVQVVYEPDKISY